MKYINLLLFIFAVLFWISGFFAGRIYMADKTADTVAQVMQNTSDELLVACESAIDREIKKCEQEKADIMAQF